MASVPKKAPPPPPPSAPNAAPPPPPPVAAAATAAPTPAATPSFSYDDDMPIPGRRTGFTKSDQPNETMQRLLHMPEGKSFIETVTVPETIVGDEERLAEFKRVAKAISNRLAGAIRRLRLQNNGALEARNYAMRVVMDAKLGYGVRVWREQDTSAAQNTPAAQS